MAWLKCDICDDDKYTDENPFVEMRTPRPSDKSDMCCTMAGHMKCFDRERTPANLVPSAFGSIATPEQWATWIESAEAQAAGRMFLT